MQEDNPDLIPQLEFEFKIKFEWLKLSSRARLDVIDFWNKNIYDFKFSEAALQVGKTGMSKKQYLKYHKLYPLYDIFTINESGEIKAVIY